MGLKVTTKVKFSGVASGAKFSKVVNGKEETEIIETHETNYDSDSRLRQELTQKHNIEYMTVFEVLEKKVEHVEDKKVEVAAPSEPVTPAAPVTPTADQNQQTESNSEQTQGKSELTSGVDGSPTDLGNAVDGVHADAGTSDAGLQDQADADPKTEVVQEAAPQTEAAPTETVVQAENQQDAVAGVGSDATVSENKQQEQA